MELDYDEEFVLVGSPGWFDSAASPSEAERCLKGGPEAHVKKKKPHEHGRARPAEKGRHGGEERATHD